MTYFKAKFLQTNSRTGFWSDLVYACFLVGIGSARELAVASFFRAPALPSLRDPVLILIEPVRVISTA